MIEATMLTLIERIHKWFGYNPNPVDISMSSRSSVCTFQLKFTNYQFTSSLLHKKFKESSTNSDKKEAYANLNQYSASELQVITSDLVNSIRNYFSLHKKSSSKPRVAIYAVKKDRSLQLLSSSYDQKNISYSRKLSADYTCFSQACDTGLPYIDNDIPRKIVQDDDYRHDGFDLVGIRNEYGTWFRKTRLNKIISILLRKFGLDKVDKQWAMIAPKNGDHPDGLYKSHLVIPITFRKHVDDGELSPALVKKLRLKDDGRTTLGVIVIDHPSEYYFDRREVKKHKNIDVNVIYLYADILSLALVTSFMYTAGSESWVKHKENEIG